MASEEIEISQLESAEELIPDMVIPVETAIATKATTLQKIKEWLSSFFVGKTVNNTLTGINTFNQQIERDLNRGGFYIKGKTPFLRENIPSKNIYTGLSLQDANGKYISLLDTQQGTSGENYMRMLVYSPNGTSCKMGMFAKDGWVRTEVATPPASDNSTQIASTAWVRMLVDNKDIENGVIYAGGAFIQWGKHEATSGYSTLLFKKPFKKTNYAITILNIGPSDSGYVSYKVRVRTTTQAEIVASSTGEVLWIAIGE